MIRRVNEHPLVVEGDSQSYPITPLRVAHVVLGLDVGGMERLIVEMTRLSNRTLISPHVISLTTRGVLADELDELGCPVAALEEEPGLQPGMVWRLAKIFRRWSIDVVHTH